MIFLSEPEYCVEINHKINGNKTFCSKNITEIENIIKKEKNYNSFEFDLSLFNFSSS